MKKSYLHTCTFVQGRSTSLSSQSNGFHAADFTHITKLVLFSYTVTGKLTMSWHFSSAVSMQLQQSGQHEDCLQMLTNTDCGHHCSADFTNGWKRQCNVKSWCSGLLHDAHHCSHRGSQFVREKKKKKQLKTHTNQACSIICRASDSQHITSPFLARNKKVQEEMLKEHPPI